MLRFIFNAMTLLSVLVFLLAAGFWVRGLDPRYRMRGRQRWNDTVFNQIYIDT